MFDAAGNLYVSDESNSIVYRVDAAGKQTVFAGTGSAGYSGDGGPASQAMLNGPSGLAIDALGNLYIADARNGSVRVVNPQGDHRHFRLTTARASPQSAGTGV